MATIGEPTPSANITASSPPKASSSARGKYMAMLIILYIIFALIMYVLIFIRTWDLQLIWILVTVLMGLTVGNSLDQGESYLNLRTVKQKLSKYLVA